MPSYHDHDMPDNVQAAYDKLILKINEVAISDEEAVEMIQMLDNLIDLI